MQAALYEARRGLGATSPNPAVGAVIVRDGEIIARGYHHRAGEPHAEIEAIRALERPELARGATIYVTLEPCSTHGRTPPCVEAIIRAGFARAVIGAVDPNPLHAGRGLRVLQEAGIEVHSGVLAAECEALNRAFNKWIVQRIPWVIAKAGMSLDGRITRPPGEGQWLTSPASRADAMELRASVDAILIGANTLREDDPQLTLRGVERDGTRQPWRVVLAGTESLLPENARLFTDEHRERTLILRGLTLPQALADLGGRGITSLLIEGGMSVLGQAFDQRLVDEVCFYVAPLLCGGPKVAIGGEGAASTADAATLLDPTYTQIGDDIRIHGRVAYPPSEGPARVG